MDKDKKNPRSSANSPARNPEMEELYRKLEPELRRPKPNPEALAAALEAAQRFAAETDAENAADEAAEEIAGDVAMVACGVCGHLNREGNNFCAMCGIAVAEGQAGPVELRAHASASDTPGSSFEPEERPATMQPTGRETHHYHHHYHHHYFPGAQEGSYPRAGTEVAREPVREEKVRSTAALRGEMSRAEAAVRAIAHEWVLACNTKHLDDVLELYVSDALVLRSNYPPIRGAAAVREFFFGALDAGLGEVEVEPLRVEVVGDLAYEAGRYKALIPGAAGKRREERGKYLWVCARQNNGQWKLAADCWSSDLSLTNLESDIPPGAVKTAAPRKSP